MRVRRLLALVAWTALLAVAVFALRAVGNNALAPPPLAAPDEWGAWLEEREPLEAAFALLRLLALGAAWYLLGTTVLGAAVRLARAPMLVVAADCVTVAPLRTLLSAVVTFGLSAPSTPPALAGGLPAASQATAGRPEVTSTSPVRDTGDDPAVPPTVVMRRLPSSAPSSPAPPASTPAPPRLPPPPAPTPPPPRPQTTTAAPQAAEWRVRPGDSFWTIAAAVLAEKGGRPVTVAETVAYWLRLIEANRPRLISPGDPDLILPGQVLALPPVDTAALPGTT